MTQERREYDTGAVRSGDCEQTRYDLISPIGLERLAQTYAEGAEKFGAFNWENGMPVNDLLNHAIAHVYKFLRGDRSEDHLAHAAWNLLGAIHSMELWPEMNADMLRGTGCTCPPAAVVKDDPKGSTQIDIEPVSTGVYAVGIGDATAAELEKLRQTVFSKGE
jgi:hypothetical protein